ILAKDYLDNGGITSADHLLMRKVEHKPQLGETYILRQLRWALASAKQYVICETPYLVLPKVAQDWVIDAATRAQNPVPVYFITNSPESNDTGPSMSWAARRIAVRMMEATRGHVSYNEWHNPTIHSKVCLADDYWVSIGTSNYDNNSATLSTEIVVGVFDHAFAGIVRAMFAQDLALSHQATYEDVQQWKSQLREQIDFGGDPDGTALMTEGMIQNLVIPFLRDGVGEERRAFMTY
ncbi:MAG: phospholipase D-like domain-containing protein, partial [Bdellovibrionota bacterium]